MAGTDNFYFQSKDIQILSELAKSLQEYTTHYEEALRYAEMVIERRSSWVTPRRVKAMALLKLGQIEEADSMIMDTLAIKEFSEGYLTKGNIMEVRGELKEAEKFYRKALKMKMESTEAKISVAHMLIESLDNRPERFHEAELL